MEKITHLSSSEIPEKFSIFKMHLCFIEKGWIKKNDRVRVETYKSLTGHLFSCIFNRDDSQQIERMDFLIEDDVTTEEIDLFLNEILTEKNIENLAGWIQMNLQSKNFDYVFKEINKRIGFGYGEDSNKWNHNIFLAPTCKQMEIAVPQGYQLGPLHACHVEMITSQWAQDIGISEENSNPDSSLASVVMSNISNRPSYGIFTKGEPSKLVAWVAVYPGGCVGMLHVAADHRRRGLARILVRRTLKVIQDTHGMSYRAHTCAFKTNTQSCNLFLSEGWELQPYNYKKMFFRKADLSKQ